MRKKYIYVYIYFVDYARPYSDIRVAADTYIYIYVYVRAYATDGTAFNVTTQRASARIYRDYTRRTPRRLVSDGVGVGAYVLRMHVAITRRLSNDGVNIGATYGSTRLCKNEKYLPSSCREFLNHLPCSSAASYRDLLETGRASLKGVGSEDL